MTAPARTRVRTSGGDNAALAAFLSGSFIAGANPVAIRFSNRELEPLWGAGVRFTAAAVVLGAVMLRMRLVFPRGAALKGAIVFGTLTFGIAFSLGYYGLAHMQAGLFQTMLAVIPLTTLLLAVAHRQERFRPRALLGALLALSGLVILTWGPLQSGLPPQAFAALAVNAFCVAEATVLIRRFPPVHPVTMNVIGMAIGGVGAMAAALALGEDVALPKEAATWIALAYMIVLGSAVVYVLYLIVLEHWSASRAAFSFVVIPVVTVVLSIWLDNEPLRAATLLGGALVLAGVYTGALRQTAPIDEL